MPLSSNYQNAFIYKIVCNDVTISDIYVGASCNFIKRKAGHKSCCNNDKNKAYNLYLYQYIRTHGGFNNWSMIKIIDYPCNNRHERDQEERRHIEILRATLNKSIPTRTDAENVEHKKDYYQNNKDQLAINKKEYNALNKEHNKEYRELHKEQISLYYQNNKEHREIKTNCLCGGKHTRYNKTHHLNSKKHKQYLELHAVTI